MTYLLPGADPERAAALARSLGLRPLTAQLLLNRGVEDALSARLFLEPRLGRLRAPEAEGEAMAGFARAADRLARAAIEHETVGLFGDYDVDGVTTCALLARFLSDAGAEVVARVARRGDGYGFGVARVEELAGAGCRLIVTGDCGTSDHEALARAQALGVEVIVVDHHQVPEVQPACYALLNPHQTSCRFPFKGLASVGVAFYLAAAVRTRLLAASHRAPEARELLDLVALGTIADLVPLTDENRVLVTAGLRELGLARRPGTQALLTVAGLCGPDGKVSRALQSSDVSFKLAPLLNAPGRLGEAQLALDLLIAPDATRAAEHAAACQDANQRRRAIQEQVYVEACDQIEADSAALSSPAVVVAGDGWHHGVVGIVAAKLVERYQRPTLVIALDGDEGRGSARVPRGSGVHLYQALLGCSEHLARFGGHAAAAGLTVSRGRLDGFRRAFAEVVARQLDVQPSAPGVPADAEVQLDEIDEGLVAELALLEPFGMGNPEPTLIARGVAVERSRVVGERHLQLTLRQGHASRDGIAFNLGPHDPGPGARVEAAFVPEIDTWRGARRLRLRVRHLERAP